MELRIKDEVGTDLSFNNWAACSFSVQMMVALFSWPWLFKGWIKLSTAWINHYLVDSVLGFANIYPLDNDFSGRKRYPPLTSSLHGDLQSKCHLNSLVKTFWFPSLRS